MTWTDDPNDRKAIRAWAHQLFGTADDADDEQERRRNIVRTEGNNPPAAISDEARARDYVRRMFNPAYAATEPELP